MKKIECPNCASANFNYLGFDKYMCEYCGTIVEERNGELLRLEVCHKKLIPISSMVRVPREMFNHFRNDESYHRHIKNTLGDSLAREIINFIDVEDEYDPSRMEYIFRATVEVAK